MELTLVRLREEDMSFVYFWVESYNDEVVSPTFESEEDALRLAINLNIGKNAYDDEL